MPNAGVVEKVTISRAGEFSCPAQSGVIFMSSCDAGALASQPNTACMRSFQVLPQRFTSVHPICCSAKAVAFQLLQSCSATSLHFQVPQSTALVHPVRYLHTAAAFQALHSLSLVHPLHCLQTAAAFQAPQSLPLMHPLRCLQTVAAF